MSQHSSISQADDVSSPYSRVKGLPHDYAKVRGTEHPYAQLNAPSTSNAAVAAATTVISSSKAATSHHGADSLQRGSQLSSGSTQHLTDEMAPQAEIPAASAIAGMISASQDLPYMTPPIANQHFSGDSQDSSSKCADHARNLQTFNSINHYRGLYKHKCPRAVGQYLGTAASHQTDSEECCTDT